MKTLLQLKGERINKAILMDREVVLQLEELSKKKDIKAKQIFENHFEERVNWGCDICKLEMWATIDELVKFRKNPKIYGY